ncbi:histidine kinase [Antarcticibacterium arcticum]|uniref:Histidine kinase n=1 Tax=Antarcticibacterium arcticum TaxID=2585771 RepID=A0A5B8YHT8_9FLAO|nr:2TM domain-containing protein [Antarcticibacterium arcticum]QED37502.1 histidine kinase [Antarcticibacterium arcticum]
MKGNLNIFFTGILIGFTLFIISLVFSVITQDTMVFNIDLLQELGLYILYSVPLTFVNGYFFNVINHRIAREKYKKFKFIFGLAGAVLFTLITLFIVRAIHKIVIEKNTYSEFLNSENSLFYFSALLVSLVITLFFHALYFYKELQEKKVKEQQVIAGTASAKFESLKNQIDPHFLFNSLNVLSSLIEENPDNAQKFTTSLSKVYRYVLEQKDKELVSVEEELAFARTYMNLLGMRFENSLFYEVPHELVNPEARVVPLSLQLLLENAIKHNIVSETRPLHIRIYEEGNYLVVENNFQKKEVLNPRRGVGLANIINRYHIVTNRKVVIDQNSKVFQVKLPILTQKISVMETILTTENNAYYKAKERVKEIKEFYGNLISYCIVIPILIFINYYTYWEFQWFWFPLFGWGLGLTIHGFSVFGYGSNWEERKIAELMAKEKQQNKTWK